MDAAVAKIAAIEEYKEAFQRVFGHCRREECHRRFGKTRLGAFQRQRPLHIGAVHLPAGKQMPLGEAVDLFHPNVRQISVFNLGDLERCSLRPGNVHSAHGWDGVLKPVVARYQGKVSPIYFRADAGFANPDIYEFFEAEGIKYGIRLPANRVWQDRISYLLKRPVGQPSNEVRRYYANFRYQAGSWNKPRRVIAKVE
jgi:Transposase DDE domain group 1